MKQRKDPKTVFLTFDDGIQPGTSETLEVLDLFEIPATYFITGIHTLYTYNRNRGHTMETLACLVNRHVIGNHSYSHCHGYYKSYYQQDHRAASHI